MVTLSDMLPRVGKVLQGYRGRRRGSESKPGSRTIKRVRLMEYRAGHARSRSRTESCKLGRGRRKGGSQRG